MQSSGFGITAAKVKELSSKMHGGTHSYAYRNSGQCNHSSRIFRNSKSVLLTLGTVSKWLSQFMYSFKGMNGSSSGSFIFVFQCSWSNQLAFRWQGKLWVTSLYALVWYKNYAMYYHVLTSTTKKSATHWHRNNSIEHSINSPMNLCLSGSVWKIYTKDISDIYINP